MVLFQRKPKVNIMSVLVVSKKIYKILRNSSYAYALMMPDY